MPGQAHTPAGRTPIGSHANARAGTLHAQTQARDVSLLHDTVSYPVPRDARAVFVKSWLPLPRQGTPCVMQPCVTLLLRDLTCTLALVGTGGTRSQPSHPGPFCGYPSSALSIPWGLGPVEPSRGTRLGRGSSAGLRGAAPAPALAPLPGASILPGASASSPGKHPGGCTPGLWPVHPPWGQHRRAPASTLGQHILPGPAPRS